MMRASIVNGTFSISELFGFWLPLYQFVCALISAAVGHPLYVAKLLSAVCGTGVCLLVFAVSMLLTANRVLSLFVFALIALNPIHIMYSSFSMSDVPYALLLMSSLYFAIKNRWVVAACFIAAAGLMRPEAWIFIALLPAIQWLRHRRVSLPAFLIALSGPALWIYISWAATGDPFEYFKVRNDYIKEVLAGTPALADLSSLNVLANLKTLLYSGGPAVMIACLIASWLLAKRIGRQQDERASESAPAVVTAALYFFSSAGFLLFVYFTKNQPAILARYCLVLFALGLPVLAWTLWTSRQWKPVWARGLLAALVAICLWQFAVQLRDGVAYINQVAQKRLVANYVRVRFREGANLRVFCDDDTVRVLAGVPEETFVDSSNSPAEAASFLAYLKENRVEYLVFEERERSAAVTLFRDLGEERINDLFQLVAATSTDIRLYRTVF